MSSVKDELTGRILANQVLMERNVFSGSFLLVEGGSDEKTFRTFVDPGGCRVIICHGKENLLEAISKLSESEFDGALAVCDKDYSDLLGYPVHNGVVIFTDENDLELMIFQSKALEKVLLEFGSSAKIDAAAESKNLRDLLFGWSVALGALRLISLRDGLALCFDGMTYQFVDARRPELCLKGTVTHVVGRTKAARNLDRDSLEQQAAELVTSHDPRTLCNGHDCVVTFCRALVKTLGSSNLFNNFKDDEGPKHMERVLRLAYEFAYFKETRVYSEICRWEEVSGYKVLRAA